MVGGRLVSTADHGWRKSTFSDQGDCVEIKFSVGRVLVRNSRRPGAEPLAFTPRKWQDFLSALAGDEMVPVTPGP
jgi:hypothetical protein